MGGRAGCFFDKLRIHITMKLTQKQIRRLINEAIQGRHPGQPEPFSVTEEINPRDYDDVQQDEGSAPGRSPEDDDTEERLHGFAFDLFVEALENDPTWSEDPDEIHVFASNLAEDFSVEVAPVLKKYLQRLREGNPEF